MDLYLVRDSQYEWGCFVFHETRNWAKQAVARRFGMEYIDMRCTTLKRGLNVHMPMVVDCETCPGYQLVLELGYKFTNGEEEE